MRKKNGLIFANSNGATNEATFEEFLSVFNMYDENLLKEMYDLYEGNIKQIIWVNSSLRKRGIVSDVNMPNMKVLNAIAELMNTEQDIEVFIDFYNRNKFIHTLLATVKAFSELKKGIYVKGFVYVYEYKICLDISC